MCRMKDDAATGGSKPPEGDDAEIETRHLPPDGLSAQLFFSVMREQVINLSGKRRGSIEKGLNATAIFN